MTARQSHEVTLAVSHLQRTGCTPGAAAAILVHNHPSGAAEPSRADELLTRGLKDALAMVDVKVADHFIVAGSGKPTSFAERGLL